MSAKYVGMPLREVYAFACEEYHLKRNSRLFNDLPADVAAVGTVRQIDVSNNYIGPKGLRALLEVVKSCPALHTLVLRDQQLTKDAVLTLCDALVAHPALRTLDLRQNPITIDGGRHLYDLVCANARIEEILLEGTDVKESLTVAIATKAARNRQHRIRLEAIYSPRGASPGRGGGGGAARRGASPPGAAASQAPAAAAAEEQRSADEDVSGGADAASGSSSAKGAQLTAADLANATLDASLAREIVQRCPMSVSSVLLDEDVHAALTERCEATRCHFLDPDFPPNVEALSPISSELPARVHGWRRIVSFHPGEHQQQQQQQQAQQQQQQRGGSAASLGRLAAQQQRGLGAADSANSGSGGSGGGIPGPYIFAGLTPELLQQQQLLKQQFAEQQGGNGKSNPGEPQLQLPPPREPLNVAPEFAWVFTSLFAVLHGSELASSLHALISPPVVNPAGVYCVKVFVDGRWRCVLVDDYLPVDADGNLAICGTEGSAPVLHLLQQQQHQHQQQQQFGVAAGIGASTDPSAWAFWPALLLKAVAKLHGSYRALMSTHLLSPTRHPTLERPASAATLMADFSGGVSVTRMLNNGAGNSSSNNNDPAGTGAYFDASAWFQTMQDLHEQKAWLVATTGPDTEATSSGGIMPFHAYRLRQCRAVNGHLLVQLHSPHSRRVWVGEWGHSSPVWESHSDVAAALAYKPSSTRGPSAPFWMRYSAFLQCFTAVHACAPCMQSYSSMVEGAWVKSTAGGPAFEPTTWWCNPHYRLRLSRPAKVLLALSVPDRRFHASAVTTMGLHVLRGEAYPLRCEREALVATTNYAVCNCVTYSAELPADGPLWVVPSTYDEGVYGRFFLRVVSSEMFSFAHENRDDHLKTYSIQCGLADTGEYQHGESNPQFAIQTLPWPKSAAAAAAAAADPFVMSAPASNNSSVATCRIAVQMHVPDTENVNVGLLLCRSTRHGGEDTPEGRLTAAGGGGISENPRTGERSVDRLLGPIADDRVLARSKLVIGKTVCLDVRDVPVTSDPYILVPCVLPHHTFNVPVSLTVWCSAPKCSLSEIPFWPCMELGVEWARSGGLQDVAQNPQVELVVRRPHQRFLLHLEVFGVADPSLILYVVRQQQGHETIALPPGHRVPDSAIVCNSQFVRHNTTTCEFEFIAPSLQDKIAQGVLSSSDIIASAAAAGDGMMSLPAHFIILPCLQPPGTSARGTIRVSSEYDDFDVTLLPLNTHDG